MSWPVSVANVAAFLEQRFGSAERRSCASLRTSVMTVICIFFFKLSEKLIKIFLIGKGTTMHLLTGLYKPTAGDAKVNGKYMFVINLDDTF
jgi:hypothetical protein